MNEIRLIYLSEEYIEFYNSLDLPVQKQVDKVINYIKSQKVISKKFLEKLQNTDNHQFEVKVSTTHNREYRILAIGVDDENLLDAEEVLMLNGFLKKSNKDYPKALTKSDNIIADYFEEEE